MSSALATCEVTRLSRGAAPGAAASSADPGACGRLPPPPLARSSPSGAPAGSPAPPWTRVPTTTHPSSSSSAPGRTHLSRRPARPARALCVAAEHATCGNPALHVSAPYSARGARRAEGGVGGVGKGGGREQAGGPCAPVRLQPRRGCARPHARTRMRARARTHGMVPRVSAPAIAARSPRAAAECRRVRELRTRARARRRRQAVCATPSGAAGVSSRPRWAAVLVAAGGGTRLGALLGGAALAALVPRCAVAAVTQHGLAR